MAGRGELPAHANVLIIGGGVMGVSAAFHLAQAGVRDVVLIDRSAFGSGSTSRAAGAVRAQFSDRVNIELGARSLTAFERFGQSPGQQIDLHQVWYLFLLDDATDVAAFERSVALQNQLGVPSRMVSAQEAGRLSPLIETDGLLAGAFSPTEGHCAPESVTLGYATAARRHGARLVSGVEATGIDSADGRIRAVDTAAGRIQTDTVVCAAGAWSARVGGWVGVDLPVTPYRRQVLVTEPIPDLPAELPMTVDFGSSFYFHGEGGGLLLGMSDPRQEPGFDQRRDEAWLPGLGDAMARRAPRLLDVGFASGWAGLYEMTPDHNALIGQAGEVEQFFYATGFSGHGFLMGPAVGEVIRDLYLGRRPPVDVAPLDARRFARQGSRPELNIV